MNRLREERIGNILSTHFGEIDWGLRQKMAPKLAREFDGRDEMDTVERIATRLSLPASAYHLGLDPPLDPTDPRRHAKLGAARAAILDRAGPAVRAELVAGAPTPEPSPPRDEAGRFAPTGMYAGKNPFSD